MRKEKLKPTFRFKTQKKDNGREAWIVFGQITHTRKKKPFYDYF